MSNYPARYAAICERWPELHAGVEYDNDAKCWHSGDYGELERNALALIRARLEDGLPDGTMLHKHEGWSISMAGGLKYHLEVDHAPTALDALLAWWENRK